MRAIVGLLCAAALAGCANGYERFYQQLPTTPAIAARLAPAVGEPSVRTSTGNQTADVDAMYSEGYVAIGVSSFNGPIQNIRGALAEAKKIGAQYVVASAAYTNTVSGAVPITLPTVNTSYTSGTVNAYGSGGYASGTYSGTTTSYGTQTNYVPYSISRYDQQAVFYAPLKRTGMGAFTRRLTTEEMQKLGTGKAVVVRAVRRGSPAYEADILPGDVIRSYNDIDAADLKDISQLKIGEPNRVVILRGGKTIEKEVTVPAEW